MRDDRLLSRRGTVIAGGIVAVALIGWCFAYEPVTQNVVLGVIAISSNCGHWEYCRYTLGKKAPYSLDEDSPYEELKWWANKDVHPNWIIDNASEHISGQQRWMDTVVSVSKMAGSA